MHTGASEPPVTVKKLVVPAGVETTGLGVAVSGMAARLGLFFLFGGMNLELLNCKVCQKMHGKFGGLNKKQ